MVLSEIFKDELVDELIAGELKWQLENDAMIDPPLQNALHMVIAYFSVPGTYMEGAYDSE